MADVDLKTIIAYDVRNSLVDIAKPATFLVDTEGIIRWKQVGENKEDFAPVPTMIAELRALLPPTSRSLSARGKATVTWASLKR